MADAKPEMSDTPEPSEAPVDDAVVADAVVVDEVIEVTPAVVEAPAPSMPPPPAPPAPEVVVEAPGEAPVEALYTSATPPQQVVYVQAPVPPRRVGNRGIGSLLAVVAAIIYAVLLAAATWVLQYATTGATGVTFLATWDFYIPVAVFAIAFIVLVLIVNRAGWGSYVFGSLFVGAAVYFGTIGIDLLINWLVWQVQDSFVVFLASPFFIIAAVLAREVAVWFGWIIARRGRKVAARNAAARAEFDATLAEFRAGAY